MISDEDLDQMLLSLSANGFSMAFRASVRDYPDPKELRKQDELAWQANRDALRTALERTDAWSRYRIY